jgi:hypothetical protein
MLSQQIDKKGECTMAKVLKKAAKKKVVKKAPSKKAKKM